MGSSYDFIKSNLEKRLSRQETEEFISFIGDDAKKMKILMDFFLNKDWHWRYNQRAAWPVGIIGCRYPDLIYPYIDEMIAIMDDPSHDAVLRNIVRVFEEIDLPPEAQGTVYEKCFHFILHTDYPIAVRCFSLTVLFNIAQVHEALIPELKSAIEMMLPHGSSGFKSRGKKILNKIEKMKI